VISDEAHHIFSPGEGGDTTPRRWMDFLTNPEFGFVYHLGLTGTPYIRNRDNDYFHDVIYRYGLKQAMEDGVTKTIDYVLKRERERIVGEESGYDETYQNHQRNREKYDGILKPLTIVVTATIFECIQEWFKLVKYIATKERVAPEVAAKKVIWVTSGLPANKEEKEEVQANLPEAERIRKENLQSLKTVDDPENPAEWILSVAMLTEGWDVKNVFQIVPHSNKAFDSKLLIAQVLGRGLRIPNSVMPPVRVIVNNHTRWTEEIANLYKEVIEVENRITWGYDSCRARYAFPLFNLEYTEKQYAVESKKKSASEPTISVLHPQERVQNQAVTFSFGGVVRYDIAVADNVEIEDAARQIKLFLKDKDPELAEKWPLGKIEKYITKALANRGYDTSFVSKENLAIIKQGFGPMFRGLGREVPRIQLEAEKLEPVMMVGMPRQSFSEGSIKGDGYLFYDSKFLASLSAEERGIIGKYIEGRKSIGPGSVPLPEIQFLVDHLFPVLEDNFKTPLNAVYVSYKPERDFANGIFNHAELFDAFIKSPDKGFYSIPYSFKPTEQGLTHVKHGSFNPDFFLRIADSKNILAVEIKSDEDTAQENKAKYRDAKEHFEELNKRLGAGGEKWRYHFYFLSPENYASFFQAIRDKKYDGWKSELMQLLEG
jgi:type III restriction enzyme